MFWKALFGPRVVAIKGRDGKTRGKCPKCGAGIKILPMKPGAEAFRCEKCGESAKWE